MISTSVTRARRTLKSDGPAKNATSSRSATRTIQLVCKWYPSWSCAEMDHRSPAREDVDTVDIGAAGPTEPRHRQTERETSARPACRRRHRMPVRPASCSPPGIVGYPDRMAGSSAVSWTRRLSDACETAFTLMNPRPDPRSCALPGAGQNSRIVNSKASIVFTVHLPPGAPDRVPASPVPYPERYRWQNALARRGANAGLDPRAWIEGRPFERRLNVARQLERRAGQQVDSEHERRSLREHMRPLPSSNRLAGHQPRHHRVPGIAPQPAARGTPDRQVDGCEALLPEAEGRIALAAWKIDERRGHTHHFIVDDHLCPGWVGRDGHDLSAAVHEAGARR